MFVCALKLSPAPTYRPAPTFRYTDSYNRKRSYFTFAVSPGPVSLPSPYVFCEVSDSRLSPCANQRLPSEKIANFIPDSIWPFCDTLTPPDTDEMCVLSASPLKKATLPARPAFTPVEGFEPTEGAI